MLELRLLVKCPLLIDDELSVSFSVWFARSRYLSTSQSLTYVNVNSLRRTTRGLRKGLTSARHSPALLAPPLWRAALPLEQAAHPRSLFDERIGLGTLGSHASPFSFVRNGVS